MGHEDLLKCKRVVGTFSSDLPWGQSMPEAWRGLLPTSTATLSGVSGGARGGAQTGDLWQSAWPSSLTQQQKVTFLIPLHMIDGLEKQNGCHHSGVFSCVQRGEATLGGLHSNSGPPEPSFWTLGELAVPQLPHLWCNIHSAGKMGGILLEWEGPGCQRNLGASLL